MYDAIVLGAGSAGLSAASILRKAGLKYLIIHHGFKGTTCASRGCMPSKALIQVAKSYHERVKFDVFGITGGGGLAVDVPTALAHVRSLRDRFVGGIVDGYDKYEIVYGACKFTSSDTVEVEGKAYQAKHFIVCTGSSPRIPEPFQPYAKELLTTDNLFEQKDLPKHIAVIGLGNIGVEMGQSLARFGIKVTGITNGKTIAGLKDAQMLKVAQDILSQDMTLMLEKDIKAVEKQGTGYRIMTSQQTIECDQILLAAGRTANLDGLGLQEIGVEFDKRGTPKIDSQTLKANGLPIYFSGDVNGKKALLHEAHDESSIITAHILNKESPGRRVPLQITFTDPVIAKVGRLAEEIDEDMVTGCVSFEDQGRARVMGENHGMLKVVARKKDNVVLGASIIAPAGEHMAHLLAMAVQQELTVAEFLRLPFYHPALEEGLRTALRQIDKETAPCITERLC